MSGAGLPRADFASSLKTVEDTDIAIGDTLEQMRSLEEHLASLREHRNTLIPIARVPTDVIEEIFFEYADPTRPKEEHFFSWSFPRLHNPWTTIVGVCRSWRQATMRCARLWSHIDLSWVRGRLELEQFLKLSQSHPLTIVGLNPRLYWHVLLQESYRLQHIEDLEIPTESTIVSAGSSHIHSSCTIELPQLESIRLRVYDANDPNILTFHAPKLRLLGCSYCSWATVRAWTGPSSVLTALRIIEIANPSTIRLTDVLDVLEQLISLQDLHIYNAICAPGPITDRVPPSSRRVTLSKLKKIQLQFSSESRDSWSAGFSSLLAHLAFPWETTLSMDIWKAHLWVRASTESWVPGLRFTLRSLAVGRMAPDAMASNGLRRRQPSYRSAAIVDPRHSGYTTLSLTDSDDVNTVAAPGEPLIALEIPLFYYHPFQITSAVNDAIITELLSAEIMHGITHLRLEDATLSTELWARFGASTLSSVSSMRIGLFGSFVAFVRALEDSVALPAPHVFLPHLHSLEIFLAEDRPRVTGVSLPRASARVRTGAEASGLLQRLADALAIRRTLGLGPAFVDTGSGAQEVDAALNGVQQGMGETSSCMDPMDEGDMSLAQLFNV